MKSEFKNKAESNRSLSNNFESLSCLKKNINLIHKENDIITQFKKYQNSFINKSNTKKKNNIVKANKNKTEIKNRELSYNNNGNILNNGDILNKNYILKENSQIDIETGDYYFEYQIIVTEPDYDEFNNKAIKINNYPSSDNGPEQKDFFEPQKFYGKITSINFSLNSRVGLCSYDKILNNDCNIQTNNDYEIYNILSNNVIQSYPENGESITIETRNRYI